jgi:YD repeat-containing protein
MVAIITTQGLGVVRGSGYVLGSRGQVGDAAFGNTGDNVTIDAITGNLSITRTDEIEISANNIDKDAISSYNSLGTGTDPNGDNWMVGNGRTITHLTGGTGVNTAGSSITRVDWDGSSSIFSYNTSLGVYVGRQGDGPADTLSYSNTTGTGIWTWTDGSTQMKEAYTVGVNPADSTDTYWATLTTATRPDGGAIGYLWSGNKITAMYSSGDWVQFTYSGNNLVKVNQYFSATTTTVTTTYYTYDALNRLTSVTTDLTPNDNSITDNNVVSISYTYVNDTPGDPGSTDIASITQWAGQPSLAAGGTVTGLLSFTYDTSNRVSSYTQTISSGATATTTLSYGTGSTTITDANHNVTTMAYDAHGRLTGVTYPTNANGGVPSLTFTYDTNGNVLSAADGAGNATTYGYDTLGNRTWQRSPTGVETVWTYDSGNRVISQTVYTGRDPDAGLAGTTPTGGETTLYAYNNGELVYQVSPQGEITEYDWDAYHTLRTQLVYTGYTYSGTTPISASGMAGWITTNITDKSNAQREDFYYDYRGQVTMARTYAGLNADGTPNTGMPLSITSYTYDQYGNLVMRQIDGKNIENYYYDGLNRLTSAKDITGLTTTFAYNDAAFQTTVTTATGLVTVSTYDDVGDLLHTNVSGTDISTPSDTYYTYDLLGNLTKVLDAKSNPTYYLNDADGNRTAEIDADGSVTEYRYTADNQLAATVHYANKLAPAGMTSLASSSGIGVNFGTLSAAYLTKDASNDDYQWRVYDADGKLVQLLDSGGEVTNYSYDGTGQLLSTDSYRTAVPSATMSPWRTTAPVTPYSPTADATHDEVMHNWYDADGRLIGTLDGDNHLTTYAYDAAGNMVQKTSYANAVAWSADYATTVHAVVPDAVHDETTNYVYDGRGLLVYTIDDNLNVVENQYDWYTNNLLATIAYSTAIAPTANYTVAYIKGQISSLSLKSNSANIETYTIYNNANQIVQTINGAGDVTNYTYSSTGQLATTTTFTNVVSQASMTSMEVYTPTAPVTVTTTGTDTTTHTFYDAAGRLIGTMDANNHLTAITYDAVGNKTREVTYSGTATWSASFSATLGSVTPDATRDHDVLFFYDADERLQYTLSNLAVTEYQYDFKGELVRTIAYDGQIASGTYTNAYIAGQVASHAKRITDTIYDLAGRLAYTVASNGAVTSYAYDGRGEQSSVTQYSTLYTLGASAAAYSTMVGWQTTHATDAGNRSTYYNYDAAGNLTVTLDPEGRLTAYTYDYAGRVTIETRYPTAATPVADISTLVPGTTPSTALQTKYAYDVLGRLISTTDPAGAITLTNYDVHNRVTSVVAASGTTDSATTSYTYDDAGRVLTQTDFGGTTTYTYDGKGNRLTATDATGHLTTYTYNADNQLTKVTDPLSRATSYAYDSFGDVIQTTDPLNNVTYSFYDDLGRLVMTVDPAGAATGYTYNVFDEVTSVTRYANLVTGTITAGTLPSVTADAVNDITTYTDYDSAGNATLTIDGEKYATVNAYDSFGELLTQKRAATKITATITPGVAPTVPTSANDQTTTYAYGADGELSSTTDALGDQVSNTVDVFGRTAAAKDDFANAETYGYDPDGDVTTLTDRDGNATTYKYDARGNVILTTDALGNKTYDFYNDRDQVSLTIDALGDATGYTYDPAGRLTGTTHYFNRVTGTITAGIAPTVTADATHDIATSETYDAAGQLTDSYDGDNIHTHYVYDLDGNLTSETVAVGTGDAATTSYTYDSRGNVLTETDANSKVTHYAYDNFGRLLSVTDPLGGVTSYTYDHDSRTTSVKDALGVSTSYQYDAFGNVVLTTDRNGNKVFNYYDKANRLTLTVDGEGDVTGMVYDVDSRLIAETRYATKISTTGLTVSTVPAYTANAAIDDTVYTDYDRDGRVTMTIDGEKYATQSTYDVAGNLKTVTHYYNPVTGTITAGTTPTVTADTLGRDATTTYGYDTLNRLNSTTDAAGGVTSCTYDVFGNRASETNALLGTTTYAYNKRGLVTSETLPTSTVVDGGAAIVNTYGYDGRGNRTSMVEASGRTEARTTLYTYDPDNRLTGTKEDLAQSLVSSTTYASIASANPITTYTYDANGNLIEEDDPAGARTLYWYDADDRKIITLTPVAGTTGTLTLLGYDSNGNVTSQRVFGDAVTIPATPGGAHPTTPTSTPRETDYSYTKTNLLKTTSIVGALYWKTGMTGSPLTANATVTNTYDAFGNIVEQQDANGNLTYSYYDRRGGKVAQVDANLFLTSYGLDFNGNVLKETRFYNAIATPTVGVLPSGTLDTHGNDRITDFTYDNMGRRKTETREGVAIGTISGGGALTGSTVSSQVVYTYNAMGEVTSKKEAAGDTTTYTYDHGGRQTQIAAPSYTDNTGTLVTPTTTFTYDGLNNLLSSTIGTHTTSYTYDKNGRMTSMTDALSNTHSYGYDIAGHKLIDSYSRKLSDLTTVVYDAILYTYDLAGHTLTQSTAERASPAASWGVVDTNNMMYDAWGDVIKEGANGVYAQVFNYDTAGRLTSSTAGDGTVKFYFYDLNGNQTALVTSDGTPLASGLNWGTITQTQVIQQLTTSGANAIGATATTGMVMTFTTFDKRNQALTTAAPFRVLTATGATSTLSTSQTYDAFGEILTQTDARGSLTSYAYNTMGKVVLTTLPSTAYTDASGVTYAAGTTVITTAAAYDASGRVVATTDANGYTTTRTLLAGSGYGGSDALTVETFDPDGGAFINRYDVYGDLRAKSTNGIVGTYATGERDIAYTYDALDHVITETDQLGTLVTTYAYDSVGNRVKQSNNAETYYLTTDYDADGRVSKTVDLAGNVTTYSYAVSTALTSGMSTGTYGGWVKTTNEYTGSTLLSRTETETDDYFGRTVGKLDFGGHSYTYAYNTAGQLVTATVGTETTGFTYYNAGFLHTEQSTYTGTGFSYTDTMAAGYDANGNRIQEVDSEVGTHSIWYTSSTSSFSNVAESAVITYDAMNRVTEYNDNGAVSLKPTDIKYLYDEAGNVRRMTATYTTISAGGTTSAAAAPQDYWYAYDTMNRTTVSEGVLDTTDAPTPYITFAPTALPGSGGTVGATGTYITYNFDGTRASETTSHWDRGLEEDGTPNHIVLNSNEYSYDDDGRLTEVYFDGRMEGDYELASYAYDALGRLTDYKEFAADPAGGLDTVYEHFNIHYNQDNQVTLDETKATQTAGLVDTTSTYTYVDSAGNYDEGATIEIDSSATTTPAHGSATTVGTKMINSYAFWDGAVQTQQDYTPNTGSPSTVNHSYYKNDAAGHLQSVDIRDGRPRTVNYYTDANGLIQERDETDNVGSTGDPKDMHFYISGIQVGAVGNNGAPQIELNYTSSIDQHETSPGTTPWQYGSSIPYANFDQAYDALNGFNGQDGSTNYTVSTGDTLSSIAQAIWGDSSLWYLIANANSLSASDPLVAGEVLSIPNGVTSVSANNADTFKVYDPNVAQGNTSPTAPKPKHTSGCAYVGQIIATVLTVVLSVFFPYLAPLWAVLGDAVGQGVNLADGSQSSFNWKELGMAAVTSAVTAGFGDIGEITGNLVADTAIKAALSDAVSQGIGVATGLQSKFNWGEVAAAGIGAGVTEAVSQSITGHATGVGTADYVPATRPNLFVSGMAGNIVSAATRSLINGTDFGDNLLATLPNTVGSFIGGELGDYFKQDVDDIFHNNTPVPTVTVTPQRQPQPNPGSAPPPFDSDLPGSPEYQANTQSAGGNDDGPVELVHVTGPRSPGLNTLLSADPSAFNSFRDPSGADQANGSIKGMLQVAAIDPGAIKIPTTVSTATAVGSAGSADSSIVLSGTNSGQAVDLAKNADGTTEVETVVVTGERAALDPASAVTAPDPQTVYRAPPVDLTNIHQPPGKITWGSIPPGPDRLYEWSRHNVPEEPSFWQTPTGVRIHAGLQIVGGTLQALSSVPLAAGAAASSETVIGPIVLGGAAFYNFTSGGDKIWTGIKEGWTGQPQDSVIHQALVQNGVPSNVATYIQFGADLTAGVGVPLAARATIAAATRPFVVSDPDAPYSPIVDGGGLQAHEDADGHLLLEHIDKTEADLVARLAAKPNISAASSFTDRATAEAAVSDALDANSTKISNWLAGSGPRLVIDSTSSSGDAVGITVARGSTTAVDASSYTVVLLRSTALPTGYRILTGYPTK